MELLSYQNPRLLIDKEKLREGSVSWRSPSNIAVIKYWGKYGNQLPRNPSVSLTLDKAHSETTVYFTAGNSPPGDRGAISMRFFFEDQPNPAFEQKVRKYLESLLDIFPFLRQLDLVIRSRNSFPHSSGIASSASGMSALALCLCDLERQFFGTPADEEQFRRKASFVARLGSGSACRSIYGTAAIWGDNKAVAGGSQLYAIPFEQEMHEVFRDFHDDILIVSRGEKSVSSRAGHGLMNDNPYAASRYGQANRRFEDLIKAFADGDVGRFGEIAEAEALTLHALMMMSEPPYLLLKPNSIALIERVRSLRRERGLPLYFSLDAGPNLHLLYPHEAADAVQTVVRDELLAYCQDRQCISDQVGAGPHRL